jgi:hypothetical protein
MHVHVLTVFLSQAYPVGAAVRVMYWRMRRWNWCVTVGRGVVRNTPLVVYSLLGDIAPEIYGNDIVFSHFDRILRLQNEK